MLHWIKFRWEQRKIERWMDRISRAHKAAEEKARANDATSEGLHELGYEYQFEHQLAADEMIRLTSSYYVRLANRKLIPVPEFKSEGGDWVESQKTGLYHLTPTALHQLRTTIRAEAKDRREEWTVWLVLTTGVIGALSGLIAIGLTRTSIELTKRSLEIDHRPWVTVKAANFSNISQTGTNPAVVLTIHNTGKSPALTLKIWWTLRLTDEALKPGVMPAQDIPPKSIAILASGPEPVLKIVSKKTITPAIAAGLKEQKIRIYVFGRIAYHDIFGSAHQTEYCFEPDINTSGGIPCAQWNTLN